ncbi:MAG: DUF2147 domain-containing protein [Lewinellaceae bacterium]|nr:DUF2147 domain-containing protein [Lewinellaceae bacterium]
MNILEALELFPSILLSDFLRYFITASTAYLLFWVIFIKKWEHRIIQRKALKAKKMWFEFRYSISTVLIFALIGWGITQAKLNGYTLIYDQVDDYGWLWFFISIVLMVLLHDTWFYWTHRLMHHPKIFRHVHLVHHRSTNPSPWAAYSFHPLEAIVEAAIFPIIVFSIPVHGIALLIFLIYMITRNVQGHLGIEIFPKWFIKSKWVNWHTTTTHHDLHHKHFNKNFGLYFTWWDHWFGTEHKEYRDKFEEVTSREKPDQPSGNRSSTRQSISKLKEKTKLPGVIFLLWLASSISGSAQTVAGLWQTYHEETGLPLSHIKIEETSSGIKGKVARIFLQPWEGEDPICAKCDGHRKDKKVIGMEFLWGFQKEGKEWSDGKILDPAGGKIYDSKLWLANDTTLKVRGYAGPMNLFYRTQTWLLQESGHDGHPITGIWKTIDDKSGLPKSLVEITAVNGKLSGKILKIFLLPWEGTNPICQNCSGKQEGTKIVGLTILSGFEKDRQNADKWTNGRILDPGNGKTYTSSVWLEDADTLKVKGYLGPLFRTQTWERVK